MATHCHTIDEQLAELGRQQLTLTRASQTQQRRADELNEQVFQLAAKVHDQQMQNFDNEQAMLKLVQEIAISNSRAQQYEQRLQQSAESQRQLAASLEHLTQLKQRLEHKVQQAQAIISDFATQKRQVEEQIEQTNFKISEVQHQNKLNADFNDELQHQLRDTEV